MNDAILNVAVGFLAGVVIILGVVVHRQQQQLDDATAFIHVAEAAAMGQIGRASNADFERVMDKLGR